MGVGLGLLRLEPATFWSLTPREFSAAARAVVGSGTSPSAPPGRPDLEHLIGLFPDHSLQA